MSITISHSREQAYKGDFSAKVVVTNFSLIRTYKVDFESHDKIVTTDHKKLVVESIPYIFKAHIYPDDALAVDPSYRLLVNWMFDNGTSEEAFYEDTLTKGQWNLIENTFVAPSYDTKNLFYAKVSIRIIYTVPGAEIISYIDDVYFYPYIIDQTILTEDGRYWISILKGYQFIGGMGHRSVSYESHLDSIGVLRQIFIDKIAVEI